MKIFGISFISIFIICCNKNPCDAKLCLNNGECLDGTCICPIGFSGNNCEIDLTTQQGLPVLTTIPISNITINSAQSGGHVTNNGNTILTSIGICYGTSPSPTISTDYFVNLYPLLDSINNITTNGAGTGSFSGTLPNLSPYTTYYVRAYAINSVGTAYGNQLSFNTAEQQAQIISINNCNSISSFNDTEYLYYSGMYLSLPWTTNSSGYMGSCIYSANPAQTSGGFANSGTIEFSHNFSSNGFIEFWYKRSTNGSLTQYFHIKVDGNYIYTLSPHAHISPGNWKKIRTPDINSGNHIIEFEWTLNSNSSSPWYIDEIEFWEY